MKEQSVTVCGNQIGLPMLIHVGRVSSRVAGPAAWHVHKGSQTPFLPAGAPAYEFPRRQEMHLDGSHLLVARTRALSADDSP
jgi:hypothetical protein